MPIDLTKEVAAAVAAAPVVTTPDLPPADPKADRGDTIEAPAPVTVELTADEVKLIGKEPPAADTKAGEAAVTTEVTEQVAEGEKPRDKEGKFIPKARFDEVNNRARAKVKDLEGQIAQLTARLAPAEGQADTAALEKILDERTEEYGALVADGDLVKAKAVMQEINRANRALALIEATTLSGAHAAESKNVDALGELVELYKSEYPMFDDAQTDVYQQETVDYVAKLQGRFEATGSSPAEALREAVELTVAKFGLEPKSSAGVVDLTPAITKADERKAAAVTKTLAAQKAGAPDLSKAGIDSDKVGMSKINMNDIDYDQFDKLPIESLKRLRGDFA